MTYCTTSRHTPSGYRRTTYSAEEIDAIAIYCPDTDKCYLLSVGEIGSCTIISLRLGVTRNNQARGVRWAKDYEMEDSIKQPWASCQAGAESHPMEAETSG